MKVYTEIIINHLYAIFDNKERMNIFNIDMTF